MEDVEQVPILFKFYSDLLEQNVIETLWADVVNDQLSYYKIDSIPAYTQYIAPDDIVLAEFDDTEKMLVYKETIIASGNSVVWVVITNNETGIEEIQELFFNLGCASEAVSDRFFTMEVNASVHYLKIKDKLNELKSEGVLEFMEACLSVIHQY